MSRTEKVVDPDSLPVCKINNQIITGTGIIGDAFLVRGENKIMRLAAAINRPTPLGQLDDWMLLDDIRLCHILFPTSLN